MKENKKTVDPKVYTKKYFNDIDNFKEWYVFDDFQRLIKLSKKDNILDIGCGTGSLYNYVKGHVKKYTGIDYSKKAILIGKNKGLNVKVGNAKKIKSKDRQFDKVISLNMFEHIYPEEAREISFEVRRVLKKGGKFIIQTSPTKYITDLSFGFLKLFGVRPQSLDYHVHMWSPNELKKFIEDTGFRKVVVTTSKQDNFFHDNSPKKFEKFARLLDFVMDSKFVKKAYKIFYEYLSTDIWIIATK